MYMYRQVAVGAQTPSQDLRGEKGGLDTLVFDTMPPGRSWTLLGATQMTRSVKGFAELGLAVLLAIFGTVLIRRGLAGGNPLRSDFEPADLVVIVGGVCLLAAIVALVRAVRDLIAAAVKR